MAAIMCMETGPDDVAVGSGRLVATRLGLWVCYGSSMRIENCMQRVIIERLCSGARGESSHGVSAVPRPAQLEGSGNSPQQAPPVRPQTHYSILIEELQTHCYSAPSCMYRGSAMRCLWALLESFNTNRTQQAWSQHSTCQRSA